MKTLAVALALVSATAGAETVYRSVGPDGSITYADAPTPNAVSVEAVPIETLPPDDRELVKSRRAAARAAAEAQRAIADRQQRLQAATDEIAAAEKALHDAQQAQRDGAEPLPGEREGTVGGFSRFREEYFERQRRLRQAVVEAEARLQRAYEARDAVR
ncbi:MAG TPA: DUF4124 domain-containing protein [Burkholderiales bacterium]|nr:DUF4124 domain-containing protein [Burkholderiales bacterium]